VESKLTRKTISGFLELRDDHFDLVRAFFVVSMVLTHTFEMFYLPDYNRNYTFFVTVGFVFLSGLTNSARYTRRVHAEPFESLEKLSRRALKLVVLFIVCNIIILTILPARFYEMARLSTLRLAESALFGLNQSAFGFDILVPIAVTTFLCWFFLRARSRWSLLYGLCFLALLLPMETLPIDSVNSFGVKLVLIGLIGSSLGQFLSELDWDVFLRVLGKIRTMVITGVAIILYYLLLAEFTVKGAAIVYFIHVIPTIVIGLFVYLASMNMGLLGHGLIKLPVSLLSRHMLFAYLFHILVINMVFFVVPKRSLSFSMCVLFSFLILLVTIVTCSSIDPISKRFSLAGKAYSLFFR
jgi:hypothetical protein